MKFIDKDGRIFYPYNLWEDYKAGLYDLQKPDPVIIEKCGLLLSDTDEFWDCMCQMKIDWVKCFEYNLSNKSQNRRAWLGQASCCYNHGANYTNTIFAWNLLTEKEQKQANDCAEEMINLFERDTYGEKLFKQKCSGRCDRTDELDF